MCVQEGSSALMVAAAIGHDRCVLALASTGADVNVADRVSETGERGWMGEKQNMRLGLFLKDFVWPVRKYSAVVCFAEWEWAPSMCVRAPIPRRQCACRGSVDARIVALLMCVDKGCVMAAAVVAG